MASKSCSTPCIVKGSRDDVDVIMGRDDILGTSDKMALCRMSLCILVVENAPAVYVHTSRHDL